MLCPFQSRYVHFTRVRKCHDSLTLNDFFFNHITNFRDGCSMWFFKVLLPSLVFVICTSPVSWDSLITACDSCCENLLLMQINPNLGSSVRASRPFYFLQFQALTFKHCRNFSCPNNILLVLPSYLFITEDTVRFQNHFLKNYGKMSETELTVSVLKKRSKTHKRLWKNAQKF